MTGVAILDICYLVTLVGGGLVAYEVASEVRLHAIDCVQQPACGSSVGAVALPPRHTEVVLGHRLLCVRAASVSAA